MYEQAESKTVKKLNDLIKLKKEDDKNNEYEKIMFYKVKFNMWGSESPLSAFAEDITISYGTTDPDGSKEVKGEPIEVSSPRPAESLDEPITMKIVEMSTANLRKFLGIRANFARYFNYVFDNSTMLTVGALRENIINKENVANYNKNNKTATIGLDLAPIRVEFKKIQKRIDPVDLTVEII